MTHMVRTLPVAEAKAHLTQHIRDTERGGRLIITRHGRPVAALVSVQDLDAVERGLPAGAGGLASLAGSLGTGGEFAANVERIRRGRSRPRTIPVLR